PRQEDVGMGPLVTRAQLSAAFAGLRRLAEQATFITGGITQPALDGIDPERSAFMAPTLLRVKDADLLGAVHVVEVFGPAATIVPYRDETEAATLIARGGGSLVASG